MCRYMSVHEVYVRPSTDEVLSYIAEKFEQQGIFPSGEECVVVVLEKLEEEGIHLPVHNQTMYITKVGVALTFLCISIARSANYDLPQQYSFVTIFSKIWDLLYRFLELRSILYQSPY